MPRLPYSQHTAEQHNRAWVKSLSGKFLFQSINVCHLSDLFCFHGSHGAYCGLSEVTVWLGVPFAIVQCAGASWMSSLKSQDVLVQDFNAKFPQNALNHILI